MSFTPCSQLLVWLQGGPIQGCHPCSASNKDHFLIGLIFVFHEKVARDSQSVQSFWWWEMNICEYISISWFTQLVWPPDCGWYVIDSDPFIWSKWFNSLINAAVNCGPQSEMTCDGNPTKAQHCYLLWNHLGRVSILHKTYQTGGISAEASLPNPQITLCDCSLALRSLYSTSWSKNSRIFHTLLLLSG